MDEKQLKAYRATFSDDTLRAIVLIYTFNLYGMMVSYQGEEAALNEYSVKLAEYLFDDEEFRNPALERLEEARKSSSRVDLVN